MAEAARKPEAMARGARMLRTALGPAIAGFLEDPTTVEVMLNPDGRLWIDRLSEGLSDTGATLSPADGERIVRLVWPPASRPASSPAGGGAMLAVGAELSLDQEDCLARAIRDGALDTINEAGQRIAQLQLYVPPTLDILPGFPVRAIVTRDLVCAPSGGCRDKAETRTDPGRQGETGH